jgi:hypothetical protein
MSVSNNMKQQEMGKDSTEARTPLASAFRKSGSKAPGTRAGTLEDWREGSKKSGNPSGSGKTLRDGR